MEQEMEEKYTQKGDVITKQKSEICDGKIVYFKEYANTKFKSMYVLVYDKTIY